MLRTVEADEYRHRQPGKQLSATTHAHSNTHIHARMDACMHPSIDACMHACMHARVCVRTGHAIIHRAAPKRARLAAKPSSAHSLQRWLSLARPRSRSIIPLEHPAGNKDIPLDASACRPARSPAHVCNPSCAPPVVVPTSTGISSQCQAPATPVPVARREHLHLRRRTSAAMAAPNAHQTVCHQDSAPARCSACALCPRH